MCLNVMLKLYLLILLSVFQVSFANVILNDQQIDGNTIYKLIAISSEFLPLIINRGSDQEQPLIGTKRWYAKKDFNAEKDVVFHLCTRSTADRCEQLRLHDPNSLSASSFNASQPTRFLAHGWLGGKFSAEFLSLTPAYLQNGKYNVILVDWGKGAIADYATAGQRVKSVGMVLSMFIDFLHQQTGTYFENIHLIGFSMGAHVVGIAGKCVQSGRIPVIFGLDPALHMFSFKNTEDRLTNNDANYVEVIHTNTGGYGYRRPLGHADFYVNFGNYQPGCAVAECSHMRSFRVFAEALNSKVGFLAKGCDPTEVSYLLQSRKCFHPTGVNAYMGGEVSQKKTKGVFYLTTNSSPPYAKRRFRNKL